MVKDKSRHNIAEQRQERRDARLESGEIGKDESYSLVFQTTGTYYFYDRMNQDIQATIVIK
jgi:plastocyanin